MLSLRLKTVASMVTKGNRIADIGTDHGYVPIYLVKNHIVPNALAMDINKEPLRRALNHIRDNGLEDQIETRLSDGLKEYKTGESETILIAGMGGGLVCKILMEGFHKLAGIKEFILSPHSEWDEVRRFLQENGFQIIDETMLVDEGKFYVIIKAIIGHMEYDKVIYYKYGKLLLENQHPVLYEYLMKEKRLYENLYHELSEHNYESTKVRRQEINNVLHDIHEALTYYQE